MTVPELLEVALELGERDSEGVELLLRVELELRVLLALRVPVALADPLPLSVCALDTVWVSEAVRLADGVPEALALFVRLGVSVVDAVRAGVGVSVSVAVGVDESEMERLRVSVAVRDIVLDEVNACDGDTLEVWD